MNNANIFKYGISKLLEDLRNEGHINPIMEIKITSRLYRDLVLDTYRRNSPVSTSISDFIYLYDGVGYYIKIVKDKTAELEKLKKERNRIDDEINKLNEE